MPANWILNRKVPPVVEPVTLDELKSHARIASADTGQDAQISDYIAAARDQFELRTDVALMQQTWTYQLRAMPPELYIPKPPHIAVDSVTYETDSGTELVDPSDYLVLPGGYSPARLAMFETYVTGGNSPFPWSIEFRCGVTDPANLWPGVKEAVLLLAAYMYDNRVAAMPGQVQEIPHAFEAIVAQYRVYVP